jgi:hypothetical protein
MWGAVPNHSVRTNPIASSSKDPFTPVAAAERKRSSPSPDDEDTVGRASSSTGRASFQGDRPKRVRKNVKYVIQDDSDEDSVVTDAGDEGGEEEFKVGGKEDEVVSDDGNATDGMVDED